MSPSDDKTANVDGDLKLFSDRPKKASADDKKMFGRRLGIFGFGSRAAKLPDV